MSNVTSYKENTSFVFDDDLNILIGPNGGGKSNLQKIIAVVLSNYFIHQYDFRHNDNESLILPIELLNKRALESALDPFIIISDEENNQDSDRDNKQIIEIELAPCESDIKNIRSIHQNLKKLNEKREYWEKPVEKYFPFDQIDEIASSNSFTYQIINLQLNEPEENTPAWAFKEYLCNFFIYMRLSTQIPEMNLTSPVFFFFSERSFNREATIQINQTTEQTIHDGFRNVFQQAATGSNTDLFQFGMQHFLRIRHKAVYEAGYNKGVEATELINENDDVKMLKKYLSQLGYEWDFYSDQDNIIHQFYLIKNNQATLPRKFSSGEKEIVHFLLAMFALNIKDGMILIDEPELHLHPRWQRIFLGLFRELSKDRNNQFLVATHSPSFVTPDTINDITRIYKTSNGSQKVSLKKVDLPEKKNLTRMINSQNNERIFFADKVVLVEGITDRLVFSSLIEGASARLFDNQAIEVVEVGGKQNLEQYKSLLKALKTPSYIITDLDYLIDFGSEQIKNMFVCDYKKSWEALNDKKGWDASNLTQGLEKSIQENNIEDLRVFWDYFKTRHKHLKENLSENEKKILQQEIVEFKRADTHVLAFGEIEEYLPNLPRKRPQLEEIIDMLNNNSWIIDIESSQQRLELINIVCSILGSSKDQIDKLITDISERKEVFPSSAKK
ncbi:MAG: AAA family ATPase [Rhodospirillaceae bacterium]|nr:AAA family ATPase [Rhodospirillaceae bacterium]